MCRSVGSGSLYFVPGAMGAVEGVMRSLTHTPYPIGRKRVAASWRGGRNSSCVEESARLAETEPLDSRVSL